MMFKSMKILDLFHAFLYASSNPVVRVDSLGFQDQPVQHVQYLGVCGANVDDWIIAELMAQKRGVSEYTTKELKTPFKFEAINSYLFWANGNQRYKDPENFKFSEGTSCGTKDENAEVGCGSSVTLCGLCVRSAILGNIMFGFVGRYVNIPLKNLIEAVHTMKTIGGMDLSALDDAAYTLGWNIENDFHSKPLTLQGFCESFKNHLKGSKALFENRKGEPNRHNDLSSCRECKEKTNEKRHGGNESPRKTP